MMSLTAAAAAGVREHTVRRNCVREAGSTSRRTSTTMGSAALVARPEAATMLLVFGSSPSATPTLSAEKVPLSAAISIGGTPLTISCTLLGTCCRLFQGVKKSAGDVMGIGTRNLEAIVGGTGDTRAAMPATCSTLSLA